MRIALPVKNGLIEGIGAIICFAGITGLPIEHPNCNYHMTTDPSLLTNVYSLRTRTSQFYLSRIRRKMPESK